jgi:hypothetical protein
MRACPMPHAPSEDVGSSAREPSQHCGAASESPSVYRWLARYYYTATVCNLYRAWRVAWCGIDEEFIIAGFSLKVGKYLAAPHQHTRARPRHARSPAPARDATARALPGVSQTPHTTTHHGLRPRAGALHTPHRPHNNNNYVALVCVRHIFIFLGVPHSSVHIIIG